MGLWLSNDRNLRQVHPSLGDFGQGRFLSFVDVMRHLRWTNDFAPHVGDMLEWATSAEGGLVLMSLGEDAVDMS